MPTTPFSLSLPSSLPILLFCYCTKMMHKVQNIFNCVLILTGINVEARGGSETQLPTSKNKNKNE